jgi:hypothetical protein
MAISKRFTLRHGLIAATMLAGPLVLAVPNIAHAQLVVGLAITVAPPMLPVYEQPPMPAEGYVWTPGYWAYSSEGYYWVPGTWVEPPEEGVYWTPPYWAWNNGTYAFNNGYWGPHVGYYGGINYGYGYGGDGYDGGRWNGRQFQYNRAANNFGSVHVTNVYQHNVTVINRTNVSYYGGNGGSQFRPTQQDLMAQHDRHIQVTADQTRHISAAQSNPAFAYSHNNGHPAIAATSRPADFRGAVGQKQPGINAGQHPAGPGGANHQPGAMNQLGAPAHAVAPAGVIHPAGQMNKPGALSHQAIPGNVVHPAPQMNKPAAPAYHAAPAAMPHPVQQINRPAAPAYHPVQQINRPAAPAYHPVQQMNRPAAPAYHPAQQMNRPAAAPHAQGPAGAPPQHGNQQKKPQ